MMLDDELIVEWLRLNNLLVGSNDYDVAQEFTLPANEVRYVLAGLFGSACYSGWAFVLFLKDGQLYEVSGSHCSCYGFEGQWDPEPTTLAALRLRDYDDSFGAKDIAKLDDLYTALEALLK